jgi:hypothetical protein
MSKVVNINSGEHYDIYIGRGSKWGNPFSHVPNTSAPWPVESREDAIRAYEDYLFTKRPDLVAAAKIELKNKILGCHCFPLACHGDVLLRIANE